VTIAATRRCTSRRRTALAAVALAATAALAASPAAHAAGPQPDFQMPLTCGQQIMATTYSNHGPDPDSIDMWHLDADENNISQGEPVLASADGVVTKVLKNGKDEFQVDLDHGAGWTTEHKHLESLPPLKVGQTVAQGEQIGRLGNTGIQPIQYHLHYTQLADGDPKRIQFNGKLIDTHEGNTDVFGAWTTKSGELMTSYNCPGRAFLPFDQNGRRHLFAYEAERGAAGIASVNAGATGITNPWGTTSGDRQWTHFMPFASGGDQRYLAYASATGKVEFNRIGTGGPTKLSGGTWGKGWTHLAPLTLGGQPYFIAYNSLTGARNVDRINATGTGSTTALGGLWTQGWTQIVPFSLAGVQHVLLYKGGSGEVRIIKVTGSGNTVAVSNVWSGTWATRWTHIVPMTHNGTVHLLRYSQSGWASFDKVNAGGTGVTHLAYAGWTKDWTVFSPFTVNGLGHVLVYKTSTGAAKILRLDGNGAGVTTTTDMNWTRGLA